MPCAFNIDSAMPCWRCRAGSSLQSNLMTPRAAHPHWSAGWTDGAASNSGMSSAQVMWDWNDALSHSDDDGVINSKANASLAS